MIDYPFLKAKPVYPSAKRKELNSNLRFRLVFSKNESLRLRITGNNFYKVYLNGTFLLFGPHRASHNCYRIDEIPLTNIKEKNVLLIEINGNNCKSFYSLDTRPFLCAEVLKGEEVLYYTGRDFECFENKNRYRKVMRYSFQRAFSESYHYEEKDLRIYVDPSYQGKRLACRPFPSLRILPNYVGRIPVDQFLPFEEFETGVFHLDPSIPPYEDRYQKLEEIKIFPLEELEIDPNKVVSEMIFERKGIDQKILKEGEFRTYSHAYDASGFLSFRLKVHKKAKLYLIFDDINLEKDPNKVAKILFYRNTSQNILYYELGEGEYSISSFDIYSAKYIRLALLEGEVTIEEVGIVPYENQRIALSVSFEDPKLQSIYDAAIRTFRQNSADLLMDCPSRERAGWLCDSYFSGQAEYLISGENPVEKTFLENYATFSETHIERGMVPMCYPADFTDGTYIPNWSLWYILELGDYYRRTKDERTLTKSIRNINGLINFFKRYENEIGLLENLKSWIFVEWSKANDPEFVRGVNIPTNILYAEALYQMGLYLEDPYLVDRGRKIKEKIADLAWNGSFFVDNLERGEDGALHQTDHTSETCQYYAIHFGITENKEFIDKMLDSFSPRRNDKEVYPTVYRSNVLMGDILRLMILNKEGRYEQTKREVVDYFYHMSEETGTLWEHEGDFASLNHCFTSYLINILLEASFGIKGVDFEKQKIDRIHLKKPEKGKVAWQNKKLI